MVDDSEWKAELEQRVTELELLVESQAWLHDTKTLAAPVLNEAVRQVIAEYFSVSATRLSGQNELRRVQGRVRLSHRTDTAIAQLRVARFWLVFFLKQACGLTDKPLRSTYPWYVQTDLIEAAELREKLFDASKPHPDRKMWLELGNRIRVRAVEIGAQLGEYGEENDRMNKLFGQ